jgi:hypothetical protein
MNGDQPLHHQEKNRNEVATFVQRRFFFRLALLLLGLATLLAPRAALARRWAYPDGPGKWRIVDDESRKSKESLRLAPASLSITYKLNNITF